MLNRLRNFREGVIFKVQSALFNKLIKSKNSWYLFDKSEIEGFGTNLIRLYFPIYYDKKVIRNSFSTVLEKKTMDFFESCKIKYPFANSIEALLKDIILLPLNETDKTTPYLDNYYFGVYDAAVLGTMMERFRPKKILEIGSGISTRYMKLFKTKYELSTEIICIDPNPRSEIDFVSDTIIRKPLEMVIHSLSDKLLPGDFLFLDGSHYIFQGNDTLLFFFKLLPELPYGVIIHIHDIFLPFDYVENVAKQLWTEQYILSALLMGGFNEFEVIHPAYYLTQTDNLTKNILKTTTASLERYDFKCRDDHDKGYSFWMKKVRKN